MQQQESIGKWISALYRYLQMRLNSELEPYNLGSGQFPALLVLLKNEGINQETISKTLHLDKATVARAVNKLMAKGYVVRKRDPLDGRAYVLYTTANFESVHQGHHFLFYLIHVLSNSRGIEVINSIFL